MSAERWEVKIPIEVLSSHASHDMSSVLLFSKLQARGINLPKLLQASPLHAMMALVKPTVSYGREIWGALYSEIPLPDLEHMQALQLAIFPLAPHALG